MRGFDDLSFEWAGKTYNLPAHKVLGAIARVEDIITLHELQRYGQKGSTPLAKLAMAYGVLLRYTGANVSDNEIYEAMFGTGNIDSNAIIESIVTLVAMMIPPSAQVGNKKKEEGTKVGNMEAAVKGKNLLKKPTNLPSQKKAGK